MASKEDQSYSNRQQKTTECILSRSYAEIRPKSYFRKVSSKEKNTEVMDLIKIIRFFLNDDFEMFLPSYNFTR
jgi:hypothetical protein